jgi:hypothetical protein
MEATAASLHVLLEMFCSRSRNRNRRGTANMSLLIALSAAAPFSLLPSADPPRGLPSWTAEARPT